MDHLRGHADLLVGGCDAALDAAHRLRGGAGVGLEGGQGTAVVLPVCIDLLENQSLLVGLPLQGVYPHGAGWGEPSNQCVKFEFKKKQPL